MATVKAEGMSSTRITDIPELVLELRLVRWFCCNVAESLDCVWSYNMTNWKMRTADGGVHPLTHYMKILITVAGLGISRI